MAYAVDSQTPAMKRVAAGKLVAQRTKQAREAQKKALIEAGHLLAVLNAFLIHEEPCHPSRDSDGYPLAGLDEVPTANAE